ncbi:MAG: hypothetical protein QXS54_13080 [Candidatus Methanomethylicaceae archaeon]
MGTADQKQPIIMLYEGILRAQDIFTELMVSLNLEQGGDSAKSVQSLCLLQKATA